MAREFVTTLLPADAPQGQVDEQIEMFTQARPATTRAMLTHIAQVDLRPVLPRIGVPTSLLYGDADVRASTSVANALHAKSRVRCWCSWLESGIAETSKPPSNGTALSSTFSTLTPGPRVGASIVSLPADDSSVTSPYTLCALGYDHRISWFLTAGR